MSQPRGTIQNWIAGVVFGGLAVFIGYTLPRTESTKPAASSVLAKAPSGDRKEASPAAGLPDKTAVFSPPPDDKLPGGEFGKMVALGENIFNDTATYAKGFVGNDLRCANCHIDSGRLANSAPLWAAYVAYPAYRSKNEHVNTFAERLQGCFQYSMNGEAPSLNDKVLIALESYAYALAKGAPTADDLPGRGYQKLAKPAKLDFQHGRDVYAQNCAVCHGPGGQGQATADGHVVFPPLWGPRSYNWGAGMSSITNAAGFIKANMPLGQGNTLSDEDAWAVAAYIDSQERPQDPRFQGSVAETRKAHHDSPFDLYGQTVDGVVLGQNSPPSGTVAR